VGISEALFEDAERQEALIKGMAGAAKMPRSLFIDPFRFVEQFGYRENPTGVTYDTMRTMAYKTMVIAAIVKTRVNQLADFARPQKDKFSLGFKISPVNPNTKMTESVKNRIHEIEQFMLNTGSSNNPKRDNFEEYLRKTTEDTLILDQVNAEIVPDFRGRPAEFYAVDAATIRRAKYDDQFKEYNDYNENKIIDYVQILNGVVVNEYRYEEMIFAIRNPRSSLVAANYGTSELELLVNVVTSQLYAEEFNRRFFTNSSTPKGILHIKGNIAPEQLEAFKSQWQAQIAGVSNSWKTPVINSDEELKFIGLQQSAKDMQFDEWIQYLIKVASAVYQIDPAEINFDMRDGSAQNKMFESSNESKERLSKDRGLKPLLRFTETYLSKHIVSRFDPDYKIEFAGMDSKTPEQALDQVIKEGQNYKTVNEVRKDVNLDPLEGAVGDMIMNPIAAQVFLSEQQAELMEGSPPDDEQTETLPPSDETLIQSLKKGNDYVDLEL